MSVFLAASVKMRLKLDSEIGLTNKQVMAYVKLLGRKHIHGGMFCRPWEASALASHFSNAGVVIQNISVCVSQCADSLRKFARKRGEGERTMPRSSSMQSCSFKLGPGTQFGSGGSALSAELLPVRKP